MREYLEICERAALAGGRILLDRLGTFRVTFKGAKDLVTDADHASQECIREILLKEFPSHGFLGEETSPLPRDNGRERDERECRWIVDPLDGTINYVHGLPGFAVSIALERNGEIVCGVVYDPIAEECFAALTGQGALLNGKPIRTSGCERLEHALVGVSFGAEVERDGFEVRVFLEMLAASQAVRRLGSAALNLCYVASGRLDGYSAARVHLWDIAAGLLLVREAGGRVSSLRGGAFDADRPDFACAATAPLHRELLAAIARAE